MGLKRVVVDDVVECDGELRTFRWLVRGGSDDGKAHPRGGGRIKI